MTGWWRINGWVIVYPIIALCFTAHFANAARRAGKAERVVEAARKVVRLAPDLMTNKERADAQNALAAALAAYDEKEPT